MRDYLLTFVVFSLVPLCLLRPWLGFLTWYWLGLMNPHRLTWNFAYSMPFAAWIGGATLVGMAFARDRKPILWTRETVLMILLFAYFTFTTLFAWAPDHAWPELEKVGKIFLMTILMTSMIYGRDRITAMLYTIAFSIGFYGLKGLIFVVSTGGGGQVKGPEGSFIDGNTFIGLALNMVMPLVLVLAREEKRRWLKLLLYTIFASSIVSVIFTTSRGAYLGLGAIIPLMFLRARSKWLGLMLLVPALVGAQFLPDRIFHRAELIENYQQESSANQRLQSWTVAWNVALDYPITGAGFEFEYTPDTERWLSYGNRKYDWAIKTSTAAHSIYFQILGQHGFIAFGMFVTLLFGSLLRLQRIRKAAAASGDRAWIAPYATALQIALVGYMVSGAFLSSAYFDLAWLFYALTAVFHRELRTGSVRSEQPATQSAVTPAGRASAEGA
ncbi:MAG TPA: putative O-glycosylation ligase, exosortase A system-associated [Burkholderiales bacterium]|nr:putative O-glycosylation ligase, exosortase A system-associated [Burkholderiales bacterium]